MSQILLIFDQMKETIITVAVIAAITLALVALFKHKSIHPVLIFLFCMAWTFFGVYCGFTCYHYYADKSFTVGAPIVADPYEDFNFHEYNVGKSIAWYASTDGGYEYTVTYRTSIEFDGTQNQYEILINNTPCDETSSAYGKLQGKARMLFYSVDNKLDTFIDLTINFTFYASKIELNITTSADKDNLPYLEEYTAINGFNIRIIEKIY